jgi:predicted  nucleic acid-binding Zn-ribbon protein
MFHPGVIRPMNPSIDALLDLQVIDKRRQALKQAREQQHVRVLDAEKAYLAVETSVTAASGEVAKMGALIRQYSADVARCDTNITELRSRQMNAKTNKEYMTIINGIETAKQEKGVREQSMKELGNRVSEQEAKVAAFQAQANQLKAVFEELRDNSGSAAQPGSEEQELQNQYDAAKAQVQPAFLEVYERLVKARHKMPLMRVDPVSRSTAFGGVISHNQLEQIRMGKLVVDRSSNAILYLVEREKPDAKGEQAAGEQAK